MRYGIAIAVALLIIAAGALYVRHVNRSLDEGIRQSLRDAKAEGTLPPEIDPEQSDLPDLGVQLHPSDMRQVQLARFLVGFRSVLIPVVLLGSLGIARLLRRN